MKTKDLGIKQISSSNLQVAAAGEDEEDLGVVD